MSDVEQFETVLRDKLESLKKRRQKQLAAFRGEMAERERRNEELDGFAHEFMQSVVRPRLEKLAGCFDNARLKSTEAVQGCHCGCEFDHTAMFPATARLDISISADEPVRNGVLTYHLELLPILFEFEKENHVSFPLSQPDMRALTEWLDAKLLAFVETYMRLADDDRYQRDNLVIDPVCHAQINKLYAAAQADVGGQTFYFCTDECRDRFLKQRGS
jgi:YHS domain-containing protein